MSDKPLGTYPMLQYKLPDGSSAFRMWVMDRASTDALAEALLPPAVELVLNEAETVEWHPESCDTVLALAAAYGVDLNGEQTTGATDG